jgi:hypothetical protein
MKHALWLLALLLSAAAVLTSAASFNPTIARAEVPFAFVANGKTFAPGNYQIEAGYWSGIIALVDASGNKHLMAVTPLGDPSMSVNPRLCFVRTGAGMALSEVWVSSGTGGQRLNGPKPLANDKVEIALARR